MYANREEGESKGVNLLKYKEITICGAVEY